MCPSQSLQKVSESALLAKTGLIKGIFLSRGVNGCLLFCQHSGL